MADFGFDPAIILQGRQATLGDMLEPVRQMQALRGQQMTLAEMARQQAQQQTLEDIYRQSADTPDQLPTALMRGGFGPQSFAAQDQGLQMQSAAQKLRDLAEQHFVNQLAGADSPEKYAELTKGLTPEHLSMLGLPSEYNANAIAMRVARSVPAKDQLEMQQKDRHDKVMEGLHVTDTGTSQRLGFNPETGRYDIPIGAPKPKPVAGPGLRADGSLGGWSDDALNREADAYNIKGKMPSIGNNKEAGAIKAEIARRAALRKSADDEGLAGNAAGYTANANSLKKLQTTADAMQSFEDTALKNLDTALSAAAKIPDAGGALLNKPIRAWASMMGNTDMSAYKAALTTARTEISKVLSGSTGGGAVSDSARHEVEDLMGNDATLAQLQAAAKILRTDMANRKTAVAESIGAIRGRMGGKKGAPDKTPAAGGKVTMSNGKEVLNVDPADVEEAKKEGFRVMP